MIKYFISWFCLASVVFSLDVNFSLETKYGNGSKVKYANTELPEITDNYKFFENLLDLNLSFDNGLFINTQFEYSDPPIYGNSLKGIYSSYLQYFIGDLELKVGDIYSLYGRGLSLNINKSQNIDYDNSIRGSELKYYWNDLILFGLGGISNFKYRSNPADPKDLELENTLFFGGFEYALGNLGTYSISYLYESSLIEYETIKNYRDFTLFDVGLDLAERYNEESGNILPEVNDTLITKDLNFNWNASFLGTDVYIEKVWNLYTKVLGNSVYGSKLYLSLYFDFAGTGITYEYKNYDQKYHIPTSSNAPIVFREGNSTLASRFNHAINWGDEIGHQLEINRALTDNFNFIWNYSFSHKHSKLKDNLFHSILHNKVANIIELYPYKQMYVGISGWSLKDKLFFKAGFDILDNYKYYESTPTGIFATTFPLMSTIKLSNGHSITTYYEKQYRKKNIYSNTFTPEFEDRYIDDYFSFSYNFTGFFSISYFYEDETYEKGYLYDGFVIQHDGSNKWQGIDVTGNLNSSTQLSLFYGSQKGGLVCANGVCAEQPGFDDGIKVTLRTIF